MWKLQIRRRLEKWRQARPLHVPHPLNSSTQPQPNYCFASHATQIHLFQLRHAALLVATWPLPRVLRAPGRNIGLSRPAICDTRAASLLISARRCQRRQRPHRGRRAQHSQPHDFRSPRRRACQPAGRLSIHTWFKCTRSRRQTCVKGGMMREMLRRARGARGETAAAAQPTAT